MEFDLTQPFTWAVIWGALGIIVTPFIFRDKGHNPYLGVVVGFASGFLGGIFLPVQLFWSIILAAAVFFVVRSLVRGRHIPNKSLIVTGAAVIAGVLGVLFSTNFDELLKANKIEGISAIVGGLQFLLLVWWLAPRQAHKCPNCGKQVHIEAPTCQHCGHEFVHSKLKNVKTDGVEQEALSLRMTRSDKEIEFDQGQINRDMLLRRIGKIGLAFNPLFSYFFLWAPIVVLVVFSFNNAETVSVWRGFTTQWYDHILTNTIASGTEAARFSTEIMLNAAKNSLVVGLFSTAISTIIGMLVAVSLERGNFPGKSALDAVLYLPVVIPEITQALSLAVFFSIVLDWINTQSGAKVTTGFGTIVAGHVAFSISYVTIVVRARLSDMNPRYEEAARDLGANEWQTFWRVTFPLMLPGVIAGALLAFTLSLDDFLVTFYTSGVGTTTLPIFVYGLLKTKVPPEINAISTLMLMVSTVLVGTSLIMQNRDKKA